MISVLNIPGYEILMKMGESTTANVWKARQQSLDRDVAIKVIKKQFMSDPDVVDACLREARAVAKLKNHHIMQVFDVGQNENVVYFVMELVDGPSLRSLLDIGDPLTCKRAVSIALAIAEALAEAWNAEHIFHRHLCPDVIILEKGGGIKIANLGLSGVMAAKRKQEDALPEMTDDRVNYMSPEQAAGSDPLDFTTDMYSLGAVLYHMLTGKRPFGETDISAGPGAHPGGTLPFPQDINPSLPPAAGQLIARLMMKSPGKRYSNWEAVIADLTKLRDGKLLVLKSTAGDGSTIAAPKGRTAAARRPIRIPPAAGKRQPPPVSRPAGHAADTVSVWLKLLLYTTLFTFFAWLGYQLLFIPYRNVNQVPSAPVSALPMLPAASTPSARASEPAHQEDTAAYSAGYKEDPLPDMPADTPTEVAAPVPDASQPTVPAKDANPVAELKYALIEEALSEGFTKAQNLYTGRRLAPEMSAYTAALDGISGFFSPENDPVKIIAKGFEQLIGRETFVNIGERRVDFRVEGVNGDIISTMVRTPTGNTTVLRSADFRIGQLNPSEQRRLIGGMHTPERTFAAVTLDLASGDYQTALDQADACGPMSEAVREFSRKRIDMLLE